MAYTVELRAEERERARKVRDEAKLLATSQKAQDSLSLKKRKELAVLADKVSAGRFRGAELALQLSQSLASTEVGAALVRAASSIYNADRDEGGGVSSVGSGMRENCEAAMIGLDVLPVLPSSPNLDIAPDAPTLLWKRGVVGPAQKNRPQSHPLTFPVPTVLKSLKEPLEVDFSSASRVPRTAVVLSGEAWVTLVLMHGAEGLIKRVCAWRDALPRGDTLHILIYGLSGAVGKRLEEARRGGARGTSSCTGLTMDTLCALHNHLFIAISVHVSPFDSLTQLLEGVLRLTRHLADAPYALPMSQLATVGKEKGDTPWGMMLQTLPLVSSKVAAAIQARYPTCKSLLDAYGDPRLTVAERSDLLADVMLVVGDGEGGPEGKDKKAPGKRLTKLSADIYTFFTSTDPSQVIGSSK